MPAAFRKLAKRDKKQELKAVVLPLCCGIHFSRVCACVWTAAADVERVRITYEVRPSTTRKMLSPTKGNFCLSFKSIVKDMFFIFSFISSLSLFLFLLAT